MSFKVYLAGPITGQDYKGATSWYDEVALHLRSHLSESDRDKINLYKPMRGKAYLSKEEQIADSYSDFTMSSINGINVRDFNDVKTADVILANFLTSGTRVSIGTVMEIAWARSMQKPIVIVMERGNVHDHGMLTFGNIIVPNLKEAALAVSQILLP